jgi:hypothetical protein
MESFMQQSRLCTFCKLYNLVSSQIKWRYLIWRTRGGVTAGSGITACVSRLFLCYNNIPLPPRFQQDITQNYFATHIKELGPWIYTLRKQYTYTRISQTVTSNITCNDYVKERGLSFDLIINIILSGGSLYQMKLPLESVAQLINKEFYADLIKPNLLLHMLLALQFYHYYYSKELIKYRFCLP